MMSSGADVHHDHDDSMFIVLKGEEIIIVKV